MRDVLSTVLRTDGVLGLYKGYGVAIAGVVVYRALHLGGYDALETESIPRKMAQNQDCFFAPASSLSVFAASSLPSFFVFIFLFEITALVLSRFDLDHIFFQYN
ncbi:MAG: MC/SLC25 family protein [Gaiellaceae bacterium]